MVQAEVDIFLTFIYYIITTLIKSAFFFFFKSKVKRKYNKNELIFFIKIDDP